MKTDLLFAFRTLKKIVDIPAQQKLQCNYLQKSYRGFLTKRLNSKVYQYLYTLEIFRIFLFTILKLRITGSRADLVYMMATKNQARQIAFMQSLFDAEDFIAFDLQNEKPFGLDFSVYIPALFSCFGTALHYVRRIKNPENSILWFNHILYLCVYTFFTKALKKRTPHAVLVANDHAAIPLGFASAARNIGIKTIYIQHAYITYDLPPLRFDLALLDGPCATDTYADQGHSDTPIIYRGLEGEERAMKTAPLMQNEPLTVGLFINVFEEEKFEKVLQELDQNNHIKQVILRTHPAYPVKISLSAYKKITLSPRTRTLWQDAANCDVVIGGNSSFHLSVLKYGVPTLYYSDLDYVNHDDYNFLKHDICYELKSLTDIDFAGVAKYYNDPDWKNRFGYFDASYGKDPNTMNTAMKEAIKKLIA